MGHSMTNITNSSKWVIATDDGISFTGVFKMTPSNTLSTTKAYIFTDDTEDGLMEQVFVNPEREDILFFSEPQYVIENLTPKPLP